MCPMDWVVCLLGLVVQIIGLCVVWLGLWVSVVGPWAGELLLSSLLLVVLAGITKKRTKKLKEKLFTDWGIFWSIKRVASNWYGLY